MPTKLSREQVLKVRKNADALLRKMESEEKDQVKRLAYASSSNQALLERIAGKIENDSTQEKILLGIKSLQQSMEGIYSRSKYDYSSLTSALSDLGKVVASKKDFNDTSIIRSLSAIERQMARLAIGQETNKKPAADPIDRTDDIVAAIANLSQEVKDQKIQFPTEFNIGNFPPQMVPQPVTKVAIRGAGVDDEATVDVLDNATALNVAIVDSSGNQITSFGSVSISGISHGVKVVTTAGTDVALAASTSCKRITIQAQTDNTGLIAVGGSGVDATEATGTGIILNPGDYYELDIDNLADVYIDSTVNGDGVRYTYFT